MKSQSILGNSHRRSFVNLPGSTEVGETAVEETNAKGAAPATKKAPAKKNEAKKPAAKKKTDKKAEKAEKAEKPAAKKAEKKAPKDKPAKEGRKPRVEGRIDLVYRSGPERTLAIKVAEKHGHKVEKLEKVDNCTLGVTVAGAKAAALRDEYLSRRDAWRKAQDELIGKHISKLD